MKNIAIDKDLSSIKNYLTNEGYTVQVIDNNQKHDANYLNNFDALVVSGTTSNVMGVETTSTKIPIIKANGMTSEDVKKALDRQVR